MLNVDFILLLDSFLRRTRKDCKDWCPELGMSVLKGMLGITRYAPFVFRKNISKGEVYFSKVPTVRN